MKTVLALVLLGASQLCVATPLPEPGLLRSPRIYNALVTTDAKLQPSRASPYSVPAVPVIGPALREFARVDTTHNNHHHSNGRKSHHEEEPKAGMDSPDDPAVDSDDKKSPSSRMYPETFYPQSVGYYPHPFIPYAYPLAPQPSPFGQYSSAGVGGGYQGAGSYSSIGGPGFAAGSGVGAGFGSPYGSYPVGQGVPPSAGSGVGAGFGSPYGAYPVRPGGPPSDFAIEQSSSLHMTSGRRPGQAEMIGTGGEEVDEDSSVNDEEYNEEKR